MKVKYNIRRNTREAVALPVLFGWLSQRVFLCFYRSYFDE